MHINEIRAGAFGPMRGADIALGPGLNVVHGPNEAGKSSWFAATYAQHLAAGTPPESFDKDHVRRWVVARCDPYKDPVPPIPAEVNLEAALKYIQVFEAITGQPFPLPDPARPVLDRIRANLKEFF